MGRIVTDILLITILVVFIIDLSGVVDSFKQSLSKWIGKGEIKRLKPFDCSLCVTFWSGLIYLVIVGEFNLLSLVVVSMFAYLTQPISLFLRLCKDILNCLITKIEDIL